MNDMEILTIDIDSVNVVSIGKDQICLILWKSIKTWRFMLVIVRVIHSPGGGSLKGWGRYIEKKTMTNKDLVSLQLINMRYQSYSNFNQGFLEYIDSCGPTYVLHDEELRKGVPKFMAQLK